MMTAILTASCGKEDGREQGTAPAVSNKQITFDLSRMSITQSAMTRATLTDLEMTDLWVFDYEGDVLVQTIHETSNLASATLTLDYGSHNLYFVASRGTTPSVNAPTISWEKPSDTFWVAKSLTVDENTASSQSVVMDRVTTRMRIVPTDVLTADAKKLSATPSHWYYGIDVKTGEGTDDRTTARTIDIPSSYVGTSGQLSASFYGISKSTEFTASVTVRLLDANDGVLGTATIPDASFARNRVTIFTGSVISAGKTFGITANDSWLADRNQAW